MPGSFLDQPDAIVITGATGLVGRAIAEALTTATQAPLILPVRGHHSPDQILRNWSGGPAPHILTIDAAVDPATMAQQLRPWRVTAIVHAAGSCHYSDERELSSGNQELTRFWLAVGHELGVERFVYISTAFCGGSRADIISECLHHEGQGEDLTPYMQSKRETEHLVGSSGLPYLLLRPSILIGDSRTGAYHGKLYGLYQLWAAAYRWLTTDDLSIVAEVLGDTGSLPMLHVDMFQQVFLAALQQLPANSVMHIVSPETELPRMRDFVDLWMRSAVAAAPQRTRRSAEARMKLWSAHSRVNLEISQRRWQFAHDWLDRFTPHLCSRPFVSVETLLTCQEWFRQHRLARTEPASAGVNSGKPTAPFKT